MISLRDVVRGFDAARRAKRRPIEVAHVRYVKKDAISPRTKAHAMAMDMKRYDLAAKLEGEL